MASLTLDDATTAADEWVDHTHATTYEAFVAAVEVVAKIRGFGRPRHGSPGMQSMGREVDLTEVVKYEDVMWSLTFIAIIAVELR